MLQLRLGERLPGRGGEPRMPVGDDEPHARQDLLKQLAQQLPPGLYGLAATQGDDRQVPDPVLAHV